MSPPPGSAGPGSDDDSPTDPWATPPPGSPVQGYEPPGQPPQQGQQGQPGWPGQPGYGAAHPADPRYPAYPGPPPYGGYQPRTNGKAQGAMWTGIGLLVLTFCCLAGVLGFVPIALGVMARSEIRASGGQQTGEGMALAGIITGALALALSLALIALLVLVVLRAHAGVQGFDTTGV
jgi:hypothetical protein